MSVVVNPPNPANKIVVNPPNGGNLVTVLSGIAGPTGATGASNTLTVGGTATGSPGTNAVASLSGASPSQTLYFTIPSGLKGDTGNTGATPTLSVNPTVATLGYGNNGAASIGGTLPNNPQLYLTLPAGPQGIQGNTGAKGDTGNTGATGASNTLSVGGTTTGAAGTNAIASLSGTSPNQSLYFTIPAGSDASVTSANITSALGYTPIGDAPSDGSEYARRNGAWETISAGVSTELVNGEYSVSLDSSGNTTFPNATIDSAGLLVSQGIGSYDTIGVGSTGSLGYNLNNIALNPDGSASFANGISKIDSLGKVSIYGDASSDSVLKVGSIEFQPYAVNNAWFGDNAYYDGSFKFRNNGSAGLFYFQGGGSGEEGQFRMTANGTGGDSFDPTTQLKIAYTGEFGVGNSISTSTGDFSGANFYVDSFGSATLTGNLTAANFPQTIPVTSVAGKTGDVTLSNSDISGLGSLATLSSVSASLVSGLSAVATSGSATDISTGTLNTSRLPLSMVLPNTIITSSAPALSFTQQWNASGTTFTAIKSAVLNSASAAESLHFDFQTAGASVAKIHRDGNFWTNSNFVSNGIFQVIPNTASASGSGGVARFYVSSTNNTVARGSIGIHSGSGAGAFEVAAYSGGANIWEQRNGTSAQVNRLYLTFTDASNYSRLSKTAATDRYSIAAEAAGTGSLKPLELSAYTSASDPTSSTITAGRYGVWKNSTSGIVKLWYNDGGTMKSIALV